MFNSVSSQSRPKVSVKRVGFPPSKIGQSSLSHVSVVKKVSQPRCEVPLIFVGQGM
jgi:hypothetical protein